MTWRKIRHHRARHSGALLCPPHSMRRYGVSAPIPFAKWIFIHGLIVANKEEGLGMKVSGEDPDSGWIVGSRKPAINEFRGDQPVSRIQQRHALPRARQEKYSFNLKESWLTSKQFQTRQSRSHVLCAAKYLCLIPAAASVVYDLVRHSRLGF